MSKELILHADGKPIYPIRIEQDFHSLDSFMKQLEADKCKVCLVFDSNVAKYHKEKVEEAFLPLCKSMFSYTFPAGEINKNLNTVENIYEQLILHQFDRKDILVAVGGGVTGDLTGYAAATYLRGIRFVQIPTTLLAMSDSSIGGKTGVDFRSYKNMVGAFHQPSAVYMNLSLLDTLPEREYLSGMGEIIKHGYIQDADMIPLLKEHALEIRKHNYLFLEEILYRSCLVKQSVVERDPKELGDRALLNFGHTIGHAVEKLMNFRLLHGECVALGMVSAMRISCLRGEITEQLEAEMRDILSQYGLPIHLENHGLNPEEILAATRLDKKMERGHVKFIILSGPGSAFIDHSVTDEELLSGIQAII